MSSRVFVLLGAFAARWVLVCVLVAASVQACSGASAQSSVQSKRAFSSDAGLDADVQARGRDLLKRFIEVNRYWLLTPPPTVTNYSYVFHLLGGWGATEPVLIQVESPAGASRSRRQGVLWYSLLQNIARDPASVRFRSITETNGQIIVQLESGTLTPEQTNQTAGLPPDQWPLRLGRAGARSFGCQCGNGLSSASSFGWMAFERTGGTVVIDAARMVPLKSVADFDSAAKGRIEETFSDYAEVSPNHWAPLAVDFKGERDGKMATFFHWRFKVYPEGLWLFDRGSFYGQEAAFVEQVAVNQPPVTRGTLGDSAIQAGAIMRKTYGDIRDALLERKDAATARAMLQELAPQAELALALVKGTEFEADYEAALSHYRQCLKALEAGDLEGAQTVFRWLGPLCESLESKIRTLLPSSVGQTEPKVLRQDHVEVTYTGVSQKYAGAMARTLNTARAIAIEQFGFDMPDTVSIIVTIDPPCRPALFDDGKEHIALNLPLEAMLERPTHSGWCTIYGLSHELGHMAMYRLMPQQRAGWMSHGASESWAHYFGSRVTDLVYKQCGQALWPDAYDYRAEGMRRLEQQLADKSTPPETACARQWKSLVEIVGDKGVAPLFRAWGNANINPNAPAADLRRAINAHSKAARLAAWWTAAEPELLQKPANGD